MANDNWRDYFRRANSDIFSIIEQAITVAASDYPHDFKMKRDRIAEMLFTSKTANAESGGGDESGTTTTTTHDDGGSKDTKESKTNGNGDDEDGVCNREVAATKNVNQIIDDYIDIESLEDDIEEEKQFCEEVLRIKEIIDRSKQQSDEVLFDSLKSLRLMRMSVEILKVTGIGKSVNGLRKHRSQQIGNFAKNLVDSWKNMVNEALDNAKEEISGAEVTKECEKTSTVEKEEAGLPSPPLDEGAFFATPTSMELSKSFDGIDGNGREQRTEESVLKKQVCPVKPNGAHSGESGPARPKVALQPKVQQKSDRGAMPKKPIPNHKEEKLNVNNEDARLETAKRKLQERYKEVENAKKQRTIKVVEFRDLPKQNFPKKKQQTRPHNRLRNH